MFKLEVDPQQLQQLITEAVEKALERNSFSIFNQPTLFDKKQLMDFLGIGSTKASELLNREDFPVIREFGHPRVPLHTLMIWIDEHTEWVRANAKGYWEHKGSIA
ncbi:DNA-binding protein [Paenibacillus sp. DRB1-1]|uniref:DNA-binding protein n=1 Tax=Paenibacillus sp. DRB1-1 TaxID=3422309 RepID=UPI003F97D841